jgi:uncharacterized surface protein with fasciclin (FAS1) repeats
MRKIAAGIAAASAVALIASAAPANAATGNKPLSEVLLADGDKFDGNWHDFDIVTQAVLAVLDAKPDSPVKVLTDGDVALTAFVPKDRAFQKLVKSISGKTPSTERRTFAAVAGLGIDTVEQVLLYHVVPGSTITAKQALKADGASLKTAEGSRIKVKVSGSGAHTAVKLSDRDPNASNPRVIVVDINKGNRQIAHGIDQVLRPMDLAPKAK